MDTTENNRRPITSSCHFTTFREGEQFVSYHTIGMIISGEMELNDGVNKVVLKKGDLYSARKNRLIKFIKYPTETGKFKSISIVFDNEMLQKFSSEYSYTVEKKVDDAAFIKFTKNELLHNFMQSLLHYEDLLNRDTATELLLLKQKEALMVLLKYDESLKNVLFNFAEPQKIDLEKFMNKNFHFNVHLKRFAFLTGRSLATFKRDFKSIFNTTPGRWLQQKRLQEAYYQITEKGKTASEIYLNLGFEDLSHFSFAFKKLYGEAPSKIKHSQS
ncbi:helix-turn-helix domain-containing protein [Flavobacterium aquiphilum]|uniref:helix-turn-helix domain-containing protein n=1 Tax=Flavobacterium aquiphilum TaxID=3003261 RepID=UPI00248014D8|nr:AraC family transcriptional regulator [Flavobacterium aquiphilum]